MAVLTNLVVRSVRLLRVDPIAKGAGLTLISITLPRHGLRTISFLGL